MYRRIGWVAATASALLVTKLVAGQALGCTDCVAGIGLNGSFLRDLLLGSTVVASVYFGLAWLERAPLRHVALDLAGLSAAVIGVFSLGA